MVPAPLLAQALRRAASFPGGESYELLCQAIAGAMIEWVCGGGVQLTGVTTGLAGLGNVSGALHFVAQPPLLLASMQGAGLQGSTAPLLAQALCTGLHTTWNANPYVGQSAGVALGTDSTAVALANGVLYHTLLSAHHRALCSAAGGTGAMAPAYYAGITAAVVTWWSTGTGTGVVAPAGSVFALPLTGISKSVPV